MRRVILLLGMVVLGAGATFGQSQQRARISGSGSTNTDVAALGNSVNLASGTQINGQLENSLDLKRAKPGDPVIMKTKDAVRSNGQVIAKKGSRLIGHITDVSRRTKGQGDSSLGIVFDSLDTGHGQIPLSATITSVLNTTARANANNGMVNSDMDMGSSSGTMVRSSGSGGGAGAGGLLGGVTGTVGEVTNTTSNTVGGLVNTTTSTTGGVVNATGQTVGNTSGASSSTVNGLRISPMVSGSAEGGSTLSVASDNLHLDNGTTFLIRVN